MDIWPPAGSAAAEKQTLLWPRWTLLLQAERDRRDLLAAWSGL
jgi:hypothetical protein